MSMQDVDEVGLAVEEGMATLHIMRIHITRK